jgi:hypothetical protein
MSERSNWNPQRSQDPLSHGDIQAASPSSRTVTTSLASMRPSDLEMASLSLQSTGPQERPRPTPPMWRERPPPRQVLHPKQGPFRPGADYWESTMQPAQPGNIEARTSASASSPSRRPSPPRDVTTPPQALRPVACAAVFLNVYETHQRDLSDTPQPSRRKCSITVQHHPRVNRFSEYACIPHPNRRPPHHLQFVWTYDLPDPRDNAPSLLTMDFIGCIPHRQVAVLDSLMVSLRSRIDENWSHNTWISIFLEMMVQRGIITPKRMVETMVIKVKALELPWREEFPNRGRCFAGC